MRHPPAMVSEQPEATNIYRAWSEHSGGRGEHFMFRVPPTRFAGVLEPAYLCCEPYTQSISMILSEACSELILLSRATQVRITIRGQQLGPLLEALSHRVVQQIHLWEEAYTDAASDTRVHDITIESLR